MADTYTATLGTIVMSVGGDNNTWGTNLNNSVFQILEDAIVNALSESVTGGTLDLSGSPPPAGPSQARFETLIFTGTLASNQIVKVPNLIKKWRVVNNCTLGGFTLSLQTPSGAPAVIPAGAGEVRCDGANTITVSPYWSTGPQAPNGSAAAPSYTFASELSSGWYRNGTNDIRLAIAGTDVLQVTGPGAGAPSVVNVLSPNILQQQGAQIVPAGTEVAYAGISLPAGWLWEDGTAYSRSTYTNLFNALTATATGNVHSGQTGIDGVSVDLRGKGLEGAFVEGTGIATGTTIAAIPNGTSFTLSQNATGNASAATLRILPYGQGDASTTFNVPDRRGRALFGRDNMNGGAAGRITVNAGTHLNATGGEEVHTLVAGEIPAHTHNYSGTTGTESATHTHGVTASASTATFGSGGFAGGAQPANVNTATESATHTHGYSGTTDGGTGGGAAHNNMPTFGISNYIIKT